MERLRELLSLVAGAALGGLFYRAREVEPARVVAERATLVLPRLAPAFDGYRIVHVSDVHMDRWMTPGRLGRLVDLVNEQEPDLVAITGDFLTHSPIRSTAHLAPLLAGPLSKLRASDGVVAVLGNHDHKAGADRVRRSLHEANVTELANTTMTLRRGGEELHVAGVDSPLMDQGRLDLVLRSLPEGGAAVLLAHEPDFADASAATGRFDLQLSGHSHGGQVRPPLLGAPLVPPLSRRYPAGLYDVRGMLLYTNRGLGVTLLRVRLNCRPEITVLTLRPPGPKDREPASIAPSDAQ